MTASAGLVERARGFSRRPGVRRALHVLSIAVGLAFLVPVVVELASDPLPVVAGNAGLLALAGGLFLISGLVKAHGWGLLFARHERPGTLTLAAAGGGASVSGLALPGRLDAAVRVAIVRRSPGCPTGVRRLGLSLLVLGLIDAAALAPLALAGTAAPEQSTGVRSGLAVLAVAGVGATAALVLLPRLFGTERLLRFRLVQWLNPGHLPWRRLLGSWLLVSSALALRFAALLVLLSALGLGWSVTLAILLVCAGSAAGALPVGPSGAVTQVGAFVAVLVTANVGRETAVGVATTAHGLVLLGGAATLVAALSWRGLVAMGPHTGRALARGRLRSCRP